MSKIAMKSGKISKKYLKLKQKTSIIKIGIKEFLLEGKTHCQQFAL